MSFGSMHTVTASFESTDPVDKICDFYKSSCPTPPRLPPIKIAAAIISNDSKKHDHHQRPEPRRHHKFQIANVSKK